MNMYHKMLFGIQQLEISLKDRFVLECKMMEIWYFTIEMINLYGQVTQMDKDKLPFN